MPVRVKFPYVPLEYYTERWLRIAGNQIGKTIKVDIATLLASQGKFAHVCVEVDLNKPLMPRYVMRREYYRLQYEGLQDLCFGYGRYGHRDATCPEKQNGKATTRDDTAKEHAAAEGQKVCTGGETGGPSYGEWMTVQRSRRRQPNTVKGNSVSSSGGQDRVEARSNQTRSQRHKS